MTLKMIRHLARKQYELKIPYPRYRDHIKKGTVPIHVKGKRIAAGREEFLYSNHYWQFGNSKFDEYKRFEKDPVIGNIDVTDDDDIMMIICAHETAHHIQYKRLPGLNAFKGKWEKPHGEGFQRLYRYLRRDLVNPIIKEKRNGV
jgi:hypothetical protein